jgi:predicted amidohydrolase/predicted ribosome-associated RNA-binding protein Tma20
MDLQIVDFGAKRPATVRLFIAQVPFDASEWKEEHGLVFPQDPERIGRAIERILALARQATAEVVVLPELSVPHEVLEIPRIWSEQTGGIVVAGSHYFRTKHGYVSRCPIIVSGKVYFTEKIVPAPVETSPIAGEGLSPGSTLTVLKNTSAGNLAVLICSDYLERELVVKTVSDDIDLLCVPAFQRGSDAYHSRMSIDCEEHTRGLYIAYANTLSDGLSDGRSALFGMMDQLFLNKLINAGYTDGRPPWKVCELGPEHTHLVAEIDLSQKKPLAKRTIHTRSNIVLVNVGSPADKTAERFATAIGHHDERYLRINELFVEPREYSSLLGMLDRSKLLFITGDPGIGKTYTAVRLLKHYFDLKYEPLWYAGLERAERLTQRRVLENFQPREGQVIYFEDPFGRTTFERRDSIRRVFGPLVDALREIDARVIVTSRREVFEQFRQDSYTSLDFESFTEELNVVKPSYSAAALIKILHILGASASWYSEPTCRELVQSAITAGRLATPLAIRDFVFSTERVISEEPLLERLERRRVEQKELFTEELVACDLRTKLALSLVCLFGSQSAATLSGWFNQVAQYLDPSQSSSAPLSFMDELRIQSGYRLEQYGSKATTIRFIHPYYEEAFVAAIERDATTRETTVSVVMFVARLNLSAAIHGVYRQCRKYPDMGHLLLQEIIPIIKTSGQPGDIFHFGEQLINLYQDHPQERRFLELIATTCSLRDAVATINSEHDLQVVGQGLRFCFNYRRALRMDGASKKEIQLIIEDFNWKMLINKWIEEVTFANILDSLEWAYIINRSSINILLSRMKVPDLIARFLTLTLSEQRRFLSIVEPHPICMQLSAEMKGEIPATRRFNYRKHLLKYVETSDGMIIDEGASDALKKHYNLLPVGVVEVIGEFQRGELVSLFDVEGKFLGFGSTHYKAEDIRLIKGKHSSLIDETLTYSYGHGIMARNSIALVVDKTPTVTTW